MNNPLENLYFKKKKAILSLVLVLLLLTLFSVFITVYILGLVVSNL